MVEPTPWPTTPPDGVPRAVDLIADVLHDAFKGATDVDLDMLAAGVVDAVTGDALTVELRWYDGDGGVDDAGVYVLGRANETPEGAGDYLGAPWRVGRRVGRTVYMVDPSSEDRDGDLLIGVMDTRALAAEAVEAHNQRVTGSSAPAGGAPSREDGGHRDGVGETGALLPADAAVEELPNPPAGSDIGDPSTEGAGDE